MSDIDGHIEQLRTDIKIHRTLEDEARRNRQRCENELQGVLIELEFMTLDQIKQHRGPV